MPDPSRIQEWFKVVICTANMPNCKLGLPTKALLISRFYHFKKFANLQFCISVFTCRTTQESDFADLLACLSLKMCKFAILAYQKSMCAHAGTHKLVYNKSFVILLFRNCYRLAVRKNFLRQTNDDRQTEPIANPLYAVMTW